jgi:hypothetical protein
LFTDELPSQNFAIPFCEILWRYFLVATTDQLGPMVYMNNDLQLSDKVDQWTDSPKHVTLDDLRLILQAYTARISPADSRDYSPLEIDGVIIVLNYIAQIMQPGVEMFLPPLIGITLERAWDTLNDMNGGQKNVRYIGPMFRLLG